MEKVARPRSEFGLRLREARKESGLTQGEVAQALGLSQGTVSQAEKEGDGSVHVAAYAKLLQVNPLWLATGEGPKKPEAPVAHAVSLDAFTVPTFTREELLSAKTLPAQFVFELLDDAMGSFGRAGTQVIFKGASSPNDAKPGAGVLVKDRDGGLHVRRKRQGKTPMQWVAFAPNDAYASMDSEADGLTVVGVWIGVLNRGLEDA
jgi:transcriptional regulator with XRE-family HTH domain